MASDVACTEMNVDHDSGDDLEDHLADHGDMQSRDMTRNTVQSVHIHVLNT